MGYGDRIKLDLSTTPKDWFVLDNRKGIFRLKDEAFRAVVRERADFALNRYFARKRDTLRGE